jgi:uncharacterized small protein (TIGR04563 family)
MTRRKSGPPVALDLMLPTHVWEELRAEAARLDRPMSWLVRWAWKLSREQVQAMPSHRDVVRQAAVMGQLRRSAGGAR